jgi:hypothetical protein
MSESDIRDTSKPGQVEPTPEAQPLTPPTMQEHFTGDVTSPASASSGQGQEEGQGNGASPGGKSGNQARAEEIGREMIERLKPVLVIAGDLAVKALNLTAKGVSKAASKLQERRQNGSKDS